MQLNIGKRRALFMAAGLLWTACLYLAFLSGRAMNAAVGNTLESLDLGAWSALVGMLAVIFSVALLAGRQTGGVVLRVVKIVATYGGLSLLQIAACFVVQSLAAP